MDSSDPADCCPKDWQRFYLGYRERFVDDCCIPLANGKEVRIKQAPSAKQFRQQGAAQQHKQRHGDRRHLDKQSDPALTGSTVWDGAVVLGQYLTSTSSPLLEHRRTRANPSSNSTATTTSSSMCPEEASEPCQGATGVEQQAKQQPGEESLHQPQHSQQQATLPSQQQHQQDCSHPQGEFPSPQQPSPDPGAASSSTLHGLTCLELGAGTGAVSLCLLAAGMVDYALPTDIPDMLPHLQSNVEHNSSVLDTTRALVLPLRWAEAADVAQLQPGGQQQLSQQRRRGFGVQRGVQLPVQLQPPFELIVGSDLIYYSYTASTPHSRLLLQALVQLAGPGSLIFLALSLHHNPEEVHAFLEWAEEVWGFKVERVTDGIPSEYVVPDVLVVGLRLVDQQKAQAAAAAAAAGTLRRKDEQ